MPSSSKVHYSCDFCRSRKLRCDRPLPCANCVSRGKECKFGPAVRQSARALAVQQQQQPSSSTQGAGGLDQASLLAEIQSLKKLAQDLEKRVIQNTGSQQAHQDLVNGGNPSPPTSTSSVDDGCLETSSPHGSHLSDVLAHLEQVSMGPTQDPVCFDEVLVKITNIRSITTQDEYFFSPAGQPRHFIWLPQRHETLLLLDKFIRDVSFFHHVVHRPSLADTVNQVYDQVENQESPQTGHLILLLSIIANATKAWLPRDDIIAPNAPFTAPTANAQATMWVKTTLEVLHSGRSSITPSIEAIQGLILLALLICSLEGLSLRYRSLHSTAVLLARELGLHRLDHPSSPTALPPITAELGRRIWWHLAASNWLMAARSSGPSQGVYDIHPSQMFVSKPLNINDAELSNTKTTIPHPGHPPSHPTEMSYFLSRIHLAEISLKSISSPLSASQKTLKTFDADLEDMLTKAPDFFQWNNFYQGKESTDEEIFVHTYTFRHIVNVQRIKLHMGYLGKEEKGERQKCLEAAREVIRGEREIKRSSHAFVEVRLASSGVLYGVFLATVVLVVDGWVHQDGEVGGEAEEALELVKEARRWSAAAGRVYEGLMGLRGQGQGQGQREEEVVVCEGVDEMGEMGCSGIAGFGEVDLKWFQWADFFSGIESGSIF